jgi:Mrp family chromosome partitioning ATPase
VLGLIGVAVLNLRPGEVRTAIDLSGLRSKEPVLAVVPSDGSLNATPIVVRQPVGRAVEAYAELRDTMQRLVRGGSVRVVQFSSPNDNEGATNTALNLAVMLARNGTRVAVVDLDLRSPRIHAMLNLPRSPGVTDLLTDQTGGLERRRSLTRAARPDDEALDTAAGIDLLEQELDEFDDYQFRPLEIPTHSFQGVDIVTAGSAPRSALEVLSRRRMDDLIGDLRVTYDLVIVTSPGALAGGDAAAIARHADGVVMVVQAGRSSLQTVRQALATIDRAGSRILGVLLASMPTS